ncbi:MAG: mechanosensitive ion channel family protein [Syntrophomonadaceae bacterium]|nr:mechanosensitive ion channel family protein [Syntrophomonadaceae bacterium]
MTSKFLIPAAIMALSVLLGLSLEKLLRSKLSKIAEISSIKTDDIMVSALKGMILFWLLLIGVYASLRWAFGDASWMNPLVKILVSLAILSITLVVMRITTGYVNTFSKKAEGILPSTSIFANLTKTIILIIGILIMLQYLGISITPVLTALGVGGLAVALALQDTLSNVFAGIHILLSQQIKMGDYIKLDSGEEGFVSDISWRNTSIRMMSNNMLLIPNSRLSNALITNHELPEHEMGVLINVGVAYSSDLERVEDIVCDVAREVMKGIIEGVPEFEPFIRYHTFSESSIDFTVILRTKTFTGQYMVKHEFIKRLHRRFNEEGIEIPFPIRTLYLKDGE